MTIIKRWIVARMLRMRHDQRNMTNCLLKKARAYARA